MCRTGTNSVAPYGGRGKGEQDNLFVLERFPHLHDHTVTQESDPVFSWTL
jgi:hypothetical protein